MVGVVLLTLTLLFFGFILSSDFLIKTFPNTKELLSKVSQFVENGASKVILSIISIIIGIWNFFAPNFGGSLHSPTIVGALIPSLILIFDGAVIYPNIIEILNIPKENKDKYYAFIEKYRSLAGIVTFIAGIVHIAFFNFILF